MSTYSPSLRIELITTGDQAGTWGSTTNTNLGTLVESAIAGYVSVSVTSANQAFTALNGAADEARQQTIALTTTTGANFAVYAPPAEKTYVIYNASSYTATIYNSTVIGNTTAAGTGVAIPAGATVTVWTEGTNFRLQNTYLASPTIASPTITTPSISSPTMTGTPTAPTATPGTNTTQVATTAFVGAAVTAATGSLGTMSTQNANNVAITGGSITGITDLAVADGGTGASDAAGARTNLSVPSTTGSGASGTWAINISGSAATVSSITTNQVLSATAGATVGAVGTYAFMSNVDNVVRSPGATVAGSSLRYRSAQSNGSRFGSGNYVSTPEGPSASGTWLLMGYIEGSYEYYGVNTTNSSCSSLWLRIS